MIFEAFIPNYKYMLPLAAGIRYIRCTLLYQALFAWALLVSAMLLYLPTIFAELCKIS